MSKNKGGRPKGSGNVFRQGDRGIHEITVALYGGDAYKVAQVRRQHINKKGGCHTCMKEVEDRLYGRPPQEIKFGLQKQPPLLLKGADGQVLSKGVEAPQLEEPAVEGEFTEVEEA